MDLAVFLLAGRGSRINKYTADTPKCLISVNGYPILHSMLDKLAIKGVKKTILVIGYLGDKIAESIGTTWKKMQIEYVNNDIWESTNNIYSLFLANSSIKSDFYLFEGDIIISDRAFKLLEGPGNYMAVSRWAEHLDGSMVSLSGNEVKHFYLKQDLPDSIDIKDLYKTVNIYGLSIDDYQSKIIPEMEKIIAGGETGMYYEKAFANLVNKNEIKFRSVDFSDSSWAEVDNETDLEYANRLFYS